MSDQHTQDDDHNPIKTPKQFAIVVLASFVVPIFIIIGLVYAVTIGNKPQAGSSNEAEAVAARIQKVGAVEIRDENREPRSGEEVFKGQCSTCHAAGALGAPKFGDAGAWGSRIGKGFDTLWASALKGKGNMSAQSGGDYSDFEIARGVVYMANAGGAKFAEPKAPAAAK